MIPTVYSEDFLTDYVTVDCAPPDKIWAIQSRIQRVAEFIEPEPCMVEDPLIHLLEGGYFIPDLGANARAFLEGMQDSCL
jgi:hypothetical protein